MNSDGANASPDQPDPSLAADSDNGDSEAEKRDSSGLAPGLDESDEELSPSTNGPDQFSAAQLIDLERAQVGHDLHDMLLPLIFAASANLQPLLGKDDRTSAGSPLASDLVDRIAKSNEWLQQALLVGRNLLTQIYPPELDKLSWLVAAKDTARRLCGDACELIWTIDKHSPVNDPNWDRDVAAAAYRVMIESLRNAIRHGEAESISIRCLPDELLIVDDGHGFAPEQVAPGRFGIRAMKGRAQLVGKSVSVESEPGGPTTVRMSL